MRFLITCLLIVMLLLSGCWKEPGKFNWANAAGAEQYERLMWQAIRENEWKEVEHHLAPMFVGVGGDGRHFDRPGWIGYCKSLQITDFSIGDLTVAPNGADMVITYDLRLNGAALPASQLRVISVWQQVKKGWILIAQSQTPVR